MDLEEGMMTGGRLDTWSTNFNWNYQVPVLELAVAGDLSGSYVPAFCRWITMETWKGADFLDVQQQQAELSRTLNRDVQMPDFSIYFLFFIW